jgi:hypothetical protein
MLLPVNFLSFLGTKDMFYIRKLKNSVAKTLFYINLLSQIDNFVPNFATPGVIGEIIPEMGETSFGWILHVMHFILEFSAVGWIVYFNKVKK